jgi:hypothetical protein
VLDQAYRQMIKVIPSNQMASRGEFGFWFGDLLARDSNATRDSLYVLGIVSFVIR